MANDEDNDRNALASFFGDIKMTLGHVGSTMEQLRAQLQESGKRAEQPRWIDIAGNAVAGAAGGFPASLAVITFNNNPDTGRVWNLRKLAVGDSRGPATAVAGVAYLYRGSSNVLQGSSSLITELGMIGWEDIAPTLPVVGPYGEGEVVLVSPERLFVVIANATDGTQYSATGRVLDMQDSAYTLNKSV